METVGAHLKELLETKDGTAQMVNECLNVVKKADKIIIFGAGVGGRMLYELLTKNSLEEKILCFSDNNKMKHGKQYCHNRLSIECPKDLMGKYGIRDVLVASSAYDTIKEQLVSYGFDESRIYLYNFAFMELDYTDKAFIFDHLPDFERSYGKMADEKSKRIFSNILNYKITKNVKYLEEMQADVDDERFQYFDKELFSFNPSEVFLDVGAYIGDTLEMYTKVYETWSGYIGLEADNLIYNKLNKYIADRKLESKCRTYNFAAWDKKEILYLSENPGSSTVAQKEKNGMFAVEADKVDNRLNDEHVTYIKLDIEGAEYYALNGMKGLIQKNCPIIAVCVYHLRDDFFKLTDLIENILPETYTYFFRQYRYTPTETVCYAIPKCRLIK